jgi:hypothetical protein
MPGHPQGTSANDDVGHEPARYGRVTVVA